MASIQEIRQQYPQYNDMSDADLATALHQKFYSDMPAEQFNSAVGLAAGGQAAPAPDFLDRSRQYLKDAYHDPEAGFPTKAAATLGLVPVNLARGLRDSVPSAITAPARSMTDPNFDAPSEALNLAGFISGTPVARSAAPVIREAAGAAGTALKEASPVTIAPKLAPAPTRQAIKNQSTQAYKAATDAGIIVDPVAFKDFADSATSKLKESGLNDRLHPNVAAALDDIKAAADTGEPQTLQNVEVLRRVATSAVKGAVNDDQAAKAGTLVRSIDGFINNLGPEHLIQGDAEVAVPALQNARALWAKNAKLGEIEDIGETAARQDDPNKYIKQQFTRITKDSDRFGRYSPDEQSLILSIAKTGNMEMLGKLAPSLDLTGLAKAGAYAGGAAVNPLTLALPAVGFAAKYAAKKGRQSNLQALEDTIARGGPDQSFLDRFQFKDAPPEQGPPPKLLSPPRMYVNSEGQGMTGAQAERFAPDEGQAGFQPGTTRPEESPPPQLSLPSPRMMMTPGGQALNAEQAMRLFQDERQAGVQPGTSRTFPTPQTPAPPLQLPPPRMYATPQGQAMSAEQTMRYFPDERQAGIEPGSSKIWPSDASLLSSPARDMLLLRDILLNQPDVPTMLGHARKAFRK